ncbi:hypothetical protein [Xenorhabdus bovienii]|uniref:hypothetical protein n=1 Tax=Xenorhabdus bovienii TaxID=40576 RepID=UPI0023B32A85|nr:hypothetical protein [Xenorhabdus bovienii]MDE9429066.1 hypothetical protein [Xenorhabdus bovienii]MDE9538834.1 hypothetical protein [Xenorhabdus bovienii]
MSDKVIADVTVDKIAYDMAMVLAAKDATVTTPEQLIAKIWELIPDCKKAVEVTLPAKKSFFTTQR